MFTAPGRFDRDMIQGRTRAGLVAGAARGGARARLLIAKGLTVREAACGPRIGKTALCGAPRPPFA